MVRGVGRGGVVFGWSFGVGNCWDLDVGMSIAVVPLVEGVEGLEVRSVGCPDVLGKR